MLHKYSYSDFVRLIFYCHGIIMMGMFRFFTSLLTTWGLCIADVGCLCNAWWKLGSCCRACIEHRVVPTCVMVSITLIAYVREKCEVWKTIFRACLLIQWGSELMHKALNSYYSYYYFVECFWIQDWQLSSFQGKRKLYTSLKYCIIIYF